MGGDALVPPRRPGLNSDPPPIPDDLAVSPDPRPIDPLASEDYVHTIEEAKRAIVEGEIFQVNLSHRVALPIRGTPAAAYERLRGRTPSTFGGFLEAGDDSLLSASPERFLQVRGRDVETRPIKGTRPRGRTHPNDERLSQELPPSAKYSPANTII